MIRSLYVHIPFCIKKCLYCDFNSYSNLKLQDEYIDALLKEIESLGIDRVETIFVGGGTPTVLSNRNMERLLNKLGRFASSEFTVEANPGTLNESKLKLMKKNNVNRLSIGLQAWQESLLKGLGRIHSLEDFLFNYEMARSLGFNNINIDLMFGIPGQTLGDWKETLEKVVKLGPEHISSYGLIIEEETPFYDMNLKGKLALPSEDEEREMYKHAVNFYLQHGYERYEISNFALRGFECRHNITYWRDEDYFGVGAGAHSYISGQRISNKKSIRQYIEGISSGDKIEETIKVTPEDEISEFMFLGLRMTEGIRKSVFMERFDADVYNLFPREIEELKRKSLLRDTGENLQLTDKGIDLSNQVFVSFIK